MLPLTRPIEFNKLHARLQARYKNVDELARDHRRIVLRKYDGVCGIAVLCPGVPPRMLSREGKDYSVSCGLLLEDLEQAARRADLVGPLFVMGEVWRPQCDQPTISGDFRQQRATVTDFEFRVFDMRLPASEPLPYEQRRVQYIRLADFCSQVRVAQRVYPAESATEYARMQGPGYDGLVIWDLDGLGLDDAKATGGQAVKVKPTITMDVRCTGGGLGEGKHAGRLGYLSYTTSDGKTGTVGTGFSDMERRLIWGSLVQPLASETYVGRIFEVEAMGLTPDGNLREPRFKGFRFDKTESD